MVAHQTSFGRQANISIDKFYRCLLQLGATFDGSGGIMSNARADLLVVTFFQKEILSYKVNPHSLLDYHLKLQYSHFTSRCMLTSKCKVGLIWRTFY